MASVISQPHFIFGLRRNVRNNLCFLDEQTVLYPSGNSFVCHNYIQRSQRFISGSDQTQSISALAISVNRRYLAVSECGEKATVTVFDLRHEQGRKRKVLNTGDLHLKEFLCLAFSPDSKYLIGQTGEPEWTLILWLWEKNKVVATVKTTTSNNPAAQVSFNPHNNLQFCLSGTGVFKLFRYAEGALKRSSSAKVESLNLLCHAWMSDSRVVAGTDTGRLLVFESGELRKELKMTSTAVLGHTDWQLKMKRIQENDVREGPTISRISAILSYSKGFVCTTGPGTVWLFEKTEENIYRKSREIQIPPDPYGDNLTPEEWLEIDTVCMSPAEETLAVSTSQGQLYSVNISSPDKSRADRNCCLSVHQGERLHFEFLSQPFHFRAITGLSVCIRKPLVATSSLDCSVRIWNYETKDLELYKGFQEEAHSVALHPTGLFILVGFSDKLRLMNLVLNDIRTFMEFPVRGCKECAFSHGGHMFGAVDGNDIHIYSATSFENILNLKGHSRKVLGLEWGLDDRRLVSCGMDGAVYEWNMETGKRESVSILKSCSYTGAAFSSNYKTILAVGTDFSLKEIQDCQVLKEVPGDDVAHAALAVSPSGRVVFTGTSSGTIRAITYPLPLQKEWITQQAHCGPVTKMVITCDDRFLLTVSEDGCLLISEIMDKEGQRLKSNKQIVHSEEILVTKADLEEKTQNLLELNMRLEEQQMEKEYQLRLKEMSYNEKLREISDKFLRETEALKAEQEIMKTDMEKCKHEHQESSAIVALNHSRELDDLVLSYSQRLIVEHEKHRGLQQKHESMQEDYEKQQKCAEESRSRALEELTQEYETRLQEKTQLLTQCQENAELKISELQEIVKQMEEDGEKMIHVIQMSYEKKLHAEKESHANLRRQTDVMTHKLNRVQTDVSDKCADVYKLKQERQNLLGSVGSLESNIQNLRRQISEQEQRSQEQDKRTSVLKKKNLDLEKVKFVLESQLNDLIKQTEHQQEDVKRKEDTIHQLEEELLQMDKNNTQLKLTVSDLKLKLTARDKELRKEAEKVKNTETLLGRLKSDLHECVGFIQEPSKLKDSILKIYSSYVSKTDRVEERSVDDVQKVLKQQHSRLEETVNSLRMKLTKSEEKHEKVYCRMMAEKATVAAENNELQKELLLVRRQLKDCESQLLLLKNKSGPKTEKGPEEDSKPREGQQNHLLDHVFA
ncbi:cilia- and flagella-associated protein 57 [Cololabis saira]|uniref:cilia- and flagella-associated protein 57 n=1 Tax=Cololabis saira TaxID=129043 RepID=UPI002AD4F243|nr:cilia- and flagella-associated protein 57 [Cololabis saira]